MKTGWQHTRDESGRDVKCAPHTLAEAVYMDETEARTIKEAIEKREKVAWEDVQNKPTAYPPAAHTQGWDTVADKPDVFPPAAHTQGWDTLIDPPDIAGMIQAALNAANQRRSQPQDWQNTRLATLFQTPAA